MPTAQDVRAFVADLERLVFELIDLTPRPSAEKVRLRIAHKIAEHRLVTVNDVKRARRLDRPINP